MKFLVTGGAGYIGSVLVPTLLSKGHEVVVIDSFIYNQPSLLDCVYIPKLTVVRGDARDESLISKWIRGADFIIPLACLTGAPLCAKDPWQAKSVIVSGIKTILSLRTKDQKIIYPNTNSGYGIGQSGTYCTEKSPLTPVSVYGKLKVAVEKEILERGNSIVLRLATVFGTSPRMRLDLLVNDFVYRAVNDRFVVLFEANNKRNYIHIRDVARAFLHCAENFKKMKNEVYNIGLSDANLSKLELCQEIKKQVPNFYFVEGKVGEDPDKRDYIVSNGKIERTGFKPNYSLSVGIAELIKGYQVIRRNEYSNV